MILIVEKNVEKLNQLYVSLSTKYEVMRAETGYEALSVIAKCLPELVIMSTEVSDFTGFQIMAHLDNMDDLSSIPVMMISEHQSAELEQQYLAKGAIDYLKWPVVSNVLIQRAERCMEWKKLQRNLEQQVLSKVMEIEEKKAEVERQKALAEMADKDPLTGLLSRNGAMRKVNALLEKQHYGAFCMLDMDNFKSVNDIYGHIEGDKLLIRFAEVLKKVAGENIIGRIGGDEFIIFIREKMSHQEIQRYAERIIEAVQTKIISPGKLVKISVSMGIAIVPNDGCSFDELYGNADKALYYVKNAGKNAVRFYKEPTKNKQNQKLTYADLKTIKHKVKEREEMVGSYMVDFTSFENIYRFMERNIDRDKRDVQCVLFTVAGLDAEETEREIIKEEMLYMEEAITSSLRKGDVSTIYSATQMLILLMDVDRKNATSVVNRIVSEYHKRSQDDSLTIVYEMEALGADAMEIRAMNA